MNKHISVSLTQREIDALYMAALAGLAKSQNDTLDTYAVREGLKRLSAAPHPIPRPIVSNPLPKPHSGEAYPLPASGRD